MTEITDRERSPKTESEEFSRSHLSVIGVLQVVFRIFEIFGHINNRNPISNSQPLAYGEGCFGHRGLA